ncbi:MAG TPA: response regulator [Burkholderiales bacterium]|nr:response regulator [Burkholderiales bacterium]
MSATPHILVVDDDATIRQLLAEYLSERELRVTGVPDGRDMDRVLRENVVDLIVLDLKLPSENGMSIARRLRTQSSIPIIILTGNGDDVDRIVGLELGADDYLTKPFNPRELLARIRTILRRAQVHAVAPTPGEKLRARRFAGWELDLRTRRLTSPGGERVDLTHAEFGLLSALLGSPERVLSRDQLLEMSHGFDDDVFDRSVDVQILRLRRKIESDPSRPQLIKTQRGAGYYLAAKVESVL